MIDFTRIYKQLLLIERRTGRDLSEERTTVATAWRVQLNEQASRDELTPLDVLEYTTLTGNEYVSGT